MVLGMVVLLGLYLVSNLYSSGGLAGTGRGQSGSHLDKDARIVILGAGVTGLGAAYRLNELGHRDWAVYEMADKPVGLAQSVVDDQGFTWDIGVHVLFSHFGYFDTLLVAIPIRASPIYMRDRFVGYPLQNNVWRLPPADAEKCLVGLLEVHDDAVAGVTKPKPHTFAEWVDQSFGSGIAEVFMTPYNFKVWAHPTTELNPTWVGERVATIDFKRILSNMVNEFEDVHWGPNARFRYPSRGAGKIWENVYRGLPRSRFNFEMEALEINVDDPNNKYVAFADGTRVPFDALISTIPMDKLLTRIANRPDLAAWGSEKGAFKRQTVNLVGVGVEGITPAAWNSSHWIYFPEEIYPFYRITLLTNFSPYMVPKPGEQYSVLVEVSESKYRKVDQATLVDDVIAGLKHAGVIPDGAPIVSRWQERFDYGYPVPYVELTEHVLRANDELLQLGIWSRGRFGNWRYVTGNQDHVCMQGVQAVDNILFGDYEEIVYEPNVVNGKKGQRKILPPEIKDHWDVVIPGCIPDLAAWLAPLLDDLAAADIVPRVFVYSSCKSDGGLPDTLTSKYDIRVASAPTSSANTANLVTYASHVLANYDDLNPITFFLPGAATMGASLTHPSPHDFDITSSYENRGHFMYQKASGVTDPLFCTFFEALYAFDGLDCPTAFESAAAFHISRGTLLHLLPQDYQALLMLKHA
ncbi:UDP-galactopyranose mutase [Thecamonas trahens ATCC 50062]|uniref:UDP-galactopyranose mutase n=1 Tax=Thecamonas trahens ATCC 50062 TaxID=461836 RepID=A0A0L0DR88_THETB|nr:UDP-galactopyranose mutase [Thecamonas trahens ATCC 50062]KNC54795.1 UDP-galactopyranose mutase [Thecamonas trahens ATCC 50062]|eukprot:XP_013761695.1 UDP-galactopyranose mutase [Thecamonas trahens ATCC 50062]